MDAEDDNFSSFGPPPDPSLRSWRHPSEIAAGKAAFEQPTPALEQPGRRTPILLGAAAVVGICLVGLTLVSTGSSPDSNLVASGQSSSGPVPTFAETPLLIVDSDSFSSGTAAPSAPDLTTATSTTAASAIATSTTAASTTADSTTADSTTAASTSVDSIPGSRMIDLPLDRSIDFSLGQSDNSARQASTALTDYELAAARSLESAQTSQTPAQTPGIMALFDAPNGEPLSNGIVIEGLILTSTSSLQGRDAVFAFIHSTWTALDVVAADPHSDIAVLTTPDLGTQLSPVVTAPGGPVADTGQSVAILDAHDTIIAKSTSKPEAGGELVATNDRITSADGYQIMGALLTTCRNNDLYGGAALVDDQGHVLGVIVKSDHKLAAAIPLDVAIEIGRSLMLDGSRGGGWLGVSGRTVDEGFMLDLVDPTGPAAAAGLQTGDLISRVNNKPLSDLAELLHTLRLFTTGDTIEVTILRMDTATGQIEPIILEIVLSTKRSLGEFSANQAAGNR